MDNLKPKHHHNDALPTVPFNIQRFFIDLDRAEPTQRLDRLIAISILNEERILRELSYLSLISLYTIDKYVREMCNTDYFFYVLDDKSILNLIKMSGCDDLDKKRMQDIGAQLGMAQLVYRFNTAKKFEIENPNIKQLRLNSWGRFFIEENDILNTMPSSTAKITEAFEAYFDKNLPAYQELTGLLLEKITPESANKIKKINAGLKIQLVS